MTNQVRTTLLILMALVMCCSTALHSIVLTTVLLHCSVHEAVLALELTRFESSMMMLCTYRSSWLKLRVTFTVFISRKWQMSYGHINPHVHA